MKWRDAFTIATRSVARRFGRAALTVAAVTLAATLLSALLIVAGAARTRVLNQLSHGGALAGIQVVAAAPDPGQLASDNPRPGRARELNDDALRQIRALSGVKSVTPLASNPVLVATPLPPVNGTERRGEQGLGGRHSGATTDGPPPYRDTMTGIDLAHAGRLPISVLAGRLPAPGSLTEVAVTEGYLRRLRLGQHDASRVLGTEIELGAPRVFPGAGDSQVRLRGRWTRAAIVGVVAQQAASGQLIASLDQVRIAQAWTHAGSPLTDAAGVDLAAASTYDGLFVVADGLGSVGPVRAAITRVGYSTSAPENLIASVLRYLHVVEIALTGIGLIALVIAALGITNALLAAVRERRREIGVLKAIGARDSDIRRIFLIEATLLGLTGGVLGTACGFGIALIMGSVVNQYLRNQGLAATRVGLPIMVLVAGVVGSTLLALVAGTVPAWRAAKLPARQAMGEP